MKKWNIILFGIIIFMLLMVAVGSAYMFNFSLKTEVKSTDEEDAYAYIYEHDYLKQWVDSLRRVSALKDTFIISSDGCKLHALFIAAPHKCGKTALIIHGYTDNSIRMLMIGHLYNKKLGFNVMLPDLRAHGKSTAEYIQMGWKDRLDILQWIDVTRNVFGDTTHLVIHGISMGAATTMMTSGEKLPVNVKCFVEDCGYTSVWDEFSYKLKSQFGLPAFPLLYTTSFYCCAKVGWNFKEASALEQVKKCTLPMFFIHGDKDLYVPTSMVYQLYAAKKGMKELWVVSGSTHAQSYWDHTEEYINRTSKFVDKYL